MKASVSIVTYNHEHYIARAIDSVLMQQTDFDFEILIGEDDSPDSTRSIVQQYARRYPDRIRLFLHDRTHVLSIHGCPTGRRNLLNNLTQARGKYVALLDGDDYWTDPGKLQKQVDFMETHADFSICFHNMQVVYADGQKAPHPSNMNQKETSTIQDLFAGNFIYTASCLFRNGLIKDFPDWFLAVMPGDFPLFILLAQHGPIQYLDEIMGVYRVHTGSVWGTQAEVYRTFCTAHMFETLYRHFAKTAHKHALRRAAFNHYYNVATLHEREGNLKDARATAAHLLRLQQGSSRRFNLNVYFLLLRLHAPRIYKMVILPFISLSTNKRW
jgi:glycosyltransferase involved in cell wall biosynthesis